MTFGVCEWGKGCRCLMLNFYSYYAEYYEYLLTFIHLAKPSSLTKSLLTSQSSAEKDTNLCFE